MTVAIVATGGTIGNTDDGRIAISTVLDSIRTMVAGVGIDLLDDLIVAEVLRIGGDEIGYTEWASLVDVLDDHLGRADVDGVVVTHGTYTLEETAFFLHLVLRHEKPVVVTCAQRRHASLGSDGEHNLVDAIRVAASQDSVGQGVLVVEAGAVHSARDVLKTSQHPGGFWSPHGAVGSIEEDRVTIRVRPMRLHTAGSDLRCPPSPEAWPRVDVVNAHVGADAVGIRAFVDAGARGLVVDGFSYRGFPAPLQRAALEDAANQGVAVVLSNRGRVGRVPDVGGSRFVGGDDLSAPKARILTALAVQDPWTTEDLRSVFRRY